MSNHIIQKTKRIRLDNLSIRKLDNLLYKKAPDGAFFVLTVSVFYSVLTLKSVILTSPLVMKPSFPF